MAALPAPASTPVRFELDEPARRWLAEQARAGPVRVELEVHRCCGGGKICEVRLHLGEGRAGRREWTAIDGGWGRPILVDRRILGLLPRLVRVTMGGLGPFRGLRLDLAGEDWARLLYD